MSLQSLVESLVDEIVEPWHAPIKFKLASIHIDNHVVVDQPEVYDDILFPQPITHLQWKQAIAYFCPETYSPINGFAKNGSFKALLSDLNRAAYESGYSLFSDGCTSKKCNNRRVRCTHSRRYKGKKGKEKQPPEYRQESIVNDRVLNSRVNGRSLSRRTTTSKPMSCEYTCSFSMIIKVNAMGFYFEIPKSGFTKHEFHHQCKDGEIGLNKRLLTDEQVDLIKTINASNCSAGVARNAIFAKHNGLLTSGQIRYIGGFSSQYEHPPKPETVAKQPMDQGASDRALAFIQDREYDYCMLHTGHDQDGNCHQLMSSTGHVNGKEESDINSSRPHDSLVNDPDLQKYARDHCNVLEVQEDQKLMIAFAWVIPSAKRLFLLFPEVVFVDITECTDVEKRKLFVLTIETPTGKVYVIIRAKLPNQTNWIFKWLFLDCLPKLLGKKAIRRCRLILTDGDSQEITQLDEAILLLFIEALRRRCGWHIVTQNMTRKCPNRNAVLAQCRKAFQKALEIIKLWLYSFMTDSCDTQEEYQISKALLIAYLKSSTFVGTFGQTASANILEFITRYVFPHEKYFCFYNYRKVRCYDIKTSSAHEGTNHGLKYSSDPVLPSHTFDKSIIIMCQSDERKCAKVAIEAHRNHTRTKLWTYSKTSSWLTSTAESILQQQMAASMNLLVCRDSETTYRVIMDPAKRSAQSALLPVFRRVRVVTAVTPNTGDPFFMCSCCYFERFGIPCRHTLAVMTKGTSIPLEKVISHRDLSVLHWTVYHYMAVSEETDLSEALVALAENDIPGPKIPVPFDPPEIVQSQNLSSDFKFPRYPDNCINYEYDQVASALRAIQSNAHHLSQVVYTQDSDTSDLEAEDNQLPAEEETEVEQSTFAQFEQVHEEELIDVKERSAYHACNPVFRELMEVIDGDVDAVAELKSFLYERLIAAKRQSVDQGTMQRVRAVNQQSRFVSSMLPTEKRRKTHGTK